jgi:hypothetical protein
VSPCAGPPLARLQLLSMFPESANSWLQLFPRLQAQEFVVPGAKAVTGYPGQGAASADTWQPTLWRGLGFDFSNVLHASNVSTYHGLAS